MRSIIQGVTSHLKVDCAIQQKKGSNQRIYVCRHEQRALGVVRCEKQKYQHPKRVGAYILQEASTTSDLYICTLGLITPRFRFRCLMSEFLQCQSDSSVISEEADISSCVVLPRLIFTKLTCKSR